MRIYTVGRLKIRKKTRWGRGILLAIAYINVVIISRGNGQSAVAAAAYRSGGMLSCEYTERLYCYTRKHGEVAYTQIFLPPHAPERLQDRETLWNEVEWVESKSNSRLAREIKIALQRELSLEQNIDLAREYARSLASMGMCVDLCVHDKLGNPHAHLMLTVRPIEQDGSWGLKSREEFVLDEAGQKIRL
jgi:ATP-dependent exoDNAse (exonuclease V) alpha subunit